MKRILFLLLFLPLTTTFGDGRDGGQVPNEGTQIGAKGADNLFHFLKVDASGNLSVAGSTSSSSAVGATNMVTGQVTAGSAGTLVIARATRRQVTIKNTDTSITVYIGPATVTSGNGMPLKAGESITVRWVGLVQVLAASGSPVVAYLDEYD